ncbi:MAG: hypothetical protein M0Q88_00820 [Bacilli bacterium]|nr:hypothetical protein [Bacilli bacterium]
MKLFVKILITSILAIGFVTGLAYVAYIRSDISFIQCVLYVLIAAGIALGFCGLIALICKMWFDWN